MKKQVNFFTPKYSVVPSIGFHLVKFMEQEKATSTNNRKNVDC